MAPMPLKFNYLTHLFLKYKIILKTSEVSEIWKLRGHRFSQTWEARKEQGHLQ